MISTATAPVLGRLGKSKKTVVIQCNRETMAAMWRRGMALREIAHRYEIPVAEAERIVRAELFGRKEIAA